MQSALVKYYVFHFKVKRVHYKDRSPNCAKLAVVMLYLVCHLYREWAYDV
jgi:hypothetical protein